MSLIYPNRYPGRWDPTSAQYPQGKFKNRSSPTAKDGSFCEMDWANDWAGFFGAILKNAGVTPNGSIDTATASQLYNALIGGIVKTAGLRDVGTGANQIPDMSSFSSSNSVQFLPGGWILQIVPVPSIPSLGGLVVTYPTPFPVASLGIMSGSGATSPNVPGFNTQSIDKNSFKTWNQSPTAATQAGAVLAIGR